MSIVFIKHHDETIYDVFATTEAVQKAKERALLLQQQEALRQSVDKSPPKRRNALKPQPENAIRIKSTRKEPIPERVKTLNEQNEKLSFKPSDVIKRNIDNVKKIKCDSVELMTRRRRWANFIPIDVDLKPAAIYNAKYATLPKIIGGMIKAKEQRMRMKQMEEGRFQPQCKYLIHDKRDDLLAGLKANWNERQAAYATLPLLTDTQPKRFTKSKMEKDLAQLEKDIVFVERHPYLYIYPDEE